MRRWMIAALLAGCGGASRSTEPAPGPPPPSCGLSAQKLVELLTSQRDPPPPDEAVNDLIALIRNRCEQDGWSVEAQRCLGTVKTAEDADRCGTLLTEAQQAALVRDQRARAGDSSTPPSE